MQNLIISSCIMDVSSCCFILFPAFVCYASSFLCWKMPSPLKSVLPFAYWGWPSAAGKSLPKFVVKLIKLLSVKLTKHSILQRTLNFVLIPDESRWISQERSLKSFPLVIIPRLSKLFGIVGVLNVFLCFYNINI